MLGLDMRRIVHHRVDRAYRFEMVDTLRTPRMDFHVYPDEHAFYRDLAARGGDGTAAARVFLSRRTRSKAGYRPLLDEAQLIDGLVPLGFTVVEPELLSAAAQMSLFANARVVVGLGGGGMFNTVFCRPGTKVLSIESDARFVNRHANLFASLGLDYGIIIGERAGTGENVPWHLDVEAALPAIRRFIDG